MNEQKELLTPSELEEKMVTYLRTLPENSLKEIDKILATAIWIPQAGPQRAALESEAFEVLYGGEAGGGKSDLILGVARLRHKSAAIFRRTYARLEDSTIPRSLEFYGEPKFYNASKHIWTLNKQRISFRHLERENDVLAYKSAQFDFLGMDELTEFTQLQYEYMFSRIRTTKEEQRCRIIAGTNPAVEDEGMWVFNRWAAWLDEKHPNPAKNGELRYFRRDEDGRDIECLPDHRDALSRTFIRARLSDNRYLGEDYRKTLYAIPEPYRSALASGIWGLGKQDDRWQVIPTAWIKFAQERWNERFSRNDVGHIDGISDCIGVDVAHGGKDQTVLARRVGAWFYELDKHSGVSTPDGQTVAGLIANAVGGSDCSVIIDSVGVGASAYDFSKEICNAKAFVGSEKSTHKDKSGKLGFANKRAESWWKFREALDPHSGDDIALPPDQELLADLTAPRWKMTATGIQIEKKEEIIKRINRSPDCGDAVVLGYWGMNEPEGTATMAQPRADSYLRRRYR